jgi:hypothetical protein
VKEKAQALTPAMLKVLQVANEAVYSIEIRQPGVAEALLQRGFIVITNPKEHASYPRLYFITPRGRTALRISQ